MDRAYPPQLSHRHALPVLWSALFALQAWALWGYTVDDAYIVAQYARNLASGVGFTMNAGAPATDGVTAPLWVAPGWLAASVGASPIATAKLLGAVSGMGAGVQLLRTLRRRQGGLRMGCVALVLLAAQPTFATWAVAGLSSGLAALLVTLALPRAGSRGSRAGPWAAAAMFGVRPELVPAMLLLVGLPGALRREAVGQAAQGLRVHLETWGPPLVGGIGIAAYRLSMSGELLPLSVQAKPASLADGGAYLLRALGMTTGGIGLVLVARALRVGQVRDRVVAVALITGWLSVALAGGDWMPGFRLLCPLLPLYVWLLAAVAGPGRGWRPVLLALALSLVLPITDWCLRLPEVAGAQASRQTHGRALAGYLAAHGPGTLVAAVDIGYLAYHGRVRVLDLGGVTEPAVGRLPGRHLDKRIPETLLRQRQPDWLLLHSRVPPNVAPDGRLLTFSGYPVEHRVAAMAWVRRRFVVRRVFPYAARYHYILMRRRRLGGLDGHGDAN